jgi:hypothetical protein
MDLISLLFDDTDLLIPFDFVTHHDPANTWSRASTSDPLHGEWHSYLDEKDIENWNFDYNKGLVFTWAPSFLQKNYLLTKDDIIMIYDFEHNMSNWSINAQNIQKILKSNVSKQGKHSLLVELNESNTGWKTLNSPLISCNYGSQYTWEFHIKGKDAHSVHLKVIEYNETQHIIRSNHMKGLDSGNFDWKKVSFTFIPSEFNTKFMQLQIWHGHNTNRTLPNKIWIDDVRIYNLTRHLTPNTFDIFFDVEKKDKYELFIRYFQNKEGGKISLYIDNNLLDTIISEDQINKFTWKHIQNLDLTEGDHTLTIENVGGLNAVNVFALISTNKYQDIENELSNLIEEKHLIYLYEAEEELYRENIEALTIGKDASNGATVVLKPDSKIWRNIEIFKNNKYTIAVRLNGTALININNETLTASSPTLNFVYLGSYFDIGEHKMEITPAEKPLFIWSFDEYQKNLEEWKENTIENSGYSLILDQENENSILKAELRASTTGWKLINSPLIPIKLDTEYIWKFDIKGKNAHSVHAKIVEYDQSKKRIMDHRIGSIGDRSFNWKEFSTSFSSTDANASYMQLQIWHGHNTSKPLPNIIWLDNVKTYIHMDSLIDVIWVYSSDKNETINELISQNENTAKIISYEKINPTKYIIKIQANKPFMLSFAESYNPLWTAYAKDHEYQPVPLYSVINGFWIDKTGELEIVIRFKSQEWFELGSIITIVTLFFSFGYLLYDWKKKRETTSKE